MRKGEAARRAQVRPLGRSAGRALLGGAGRWSERMTRPAVRAEGELGCGVSLLGRREKGRTGHGAGLRGKKGKKELCWVGLLLGFGFSISFPPFYFLFQPN